MLNKRNDNISSFGGFVNIGASLAVVFMISLGYVAAISDLPVTI